MQTISFKKTYIRLLSYVKPFWYLFLIAAIGNILYAGADTSVTYMLKPLVDKGFNPQNQDFEFLHRLPFYILILFVARGAGSFAGGYAMGWIGRKVVQLFRCEIYRKLLVLPAHFYDKAARGRLLSKLTFNVDQVTAATNDAVTTIVREGATTIGLMGLMIWVNWKLFLIVLCIAPAMLMIVKVATKRFRVLSRRIQNVMADVNHIAEESINAYQEIRIYHASEQRQQTFDEANN